MSNQYESSNGTTYPVPDACATCVETRAMVASIEFKLDQMIEIVGAVKDNVEPALDSLKSSPVGKMLGM